MKTKQILELMKIEDIIFNHYYMKRKKLSFESSDRISLYLMSTYEYKGDNIEFLDEIERMLDEITDYNDYGTKLEYRIKQISKEVDKDIISYRMSGLLC